MHSRPRSATAHSVTWLQINYLENTMVKIRIWLQKGVVVVAFPPQNT